MLAPRQALHADHLIGRCNTIISDAGLNPGASLCTVPQYAGHPQCADVELLTQCVGEQLYVRDSIVRALMYLQVRTPHPQSQRDVGFLAYRRQLA